MGQVYQCVGGYVEKYMFFSRFEYHIFYVLYPFVTFLLTASYIYLREIGWDGMDWIYLDQDSDQGRKGSREYGN
jgi:hypothetical protein